MPESLIFVMPFRLLADLVVLLHLTFILFAVLGGFFVIRWRKIFWFHLPAVIWAAGIEFSGRICPLTYLENWLLLKSGSEGYHGDFVANYIMPIVYPAGLTRKLQIALAIGVLILNLLIYGFILAKKLKVDSKPAQTFDSKASRKLKAERTRST